MSREVGQTANTTTDDPERQAGMDGYRRKYVLSISVTLRRGGAISVALVLGIAPGVE